MPYKDPEKQKRHAREYYLRNREKLKKASRDAYWFDPEKARASRREYMAAHPTYNSEWVAKNPGYFEKYYEEHREDTRVRLRTWRQDNPEAARLQFHRRRASKNGAKGTCTADQLRSRIDFYGGLCWMCLLKGKKTPYEAIDHVIPLSKGGTNWPSNLRPACTRCNSKKGARLP